MKMIVGLVLGLILGAGVLTYGIVVAGHQPRCGEQVMKPGDTCVNVNDGTNSDYGALRARIQNSSRLTIAGGCMILLVSGVGLVTQLRGRKRRAAAPPTAL